MPVAQSFKGASNTPLAIATLIAALFVAIQAYYARASYVNEIDNKLMEKRLNICLENFDQATELDTMLRRLADPIELASKWPPKLVPKDIAHLQEIQLEIVPLLNSLESGLSKATIYGKLDKHRLYWASLIEGLGQSLLSFVPNNMYKSNAQDELDKIFEKLSQFIGAQYSFFEGCRSVSKGEENAA